MSAISNFLRHPVSEFFHANKWLTGEGGWSFLSHERLIVDAVISILPPHIQDLVQRQLRQRFFVDRIGGGGRINDIWFDAPDPALKITDPAFVDKSIRVFLKVDGKRQRTLVKFRKGYIDAIQLPKVRKFYRQAKEITVVKVEEGKKTESYEAAVDRLEHGRDPG